ncbi:MAG: hypothetical protein CL677_02155 [Bdellovibrionaceae bacterium]|nr:hypothetical protein [Pseudobdellovibrionaceae bacterium]|tara:strand:- start:68075 stop:69928 length:1854 start_codon:yes stop_codon:yes gene_type:complete
MSQIGKKTRNKIGKGKNPYTRFEKIDGTHPWQKEMPESCVLYRARVLNTGSITYFNFQLAKEMGLIPKDHPNELNSELSKAILNTFNLRIINEYDEENEKQFDDKSIKENKYMATRYLQLQHQNKTGLTSGDGRGIWNGFLKFKASEWDISSRGTGVTCLSPGAALAGKNLETGNIDHGYGCGLAEIDELYSSAIMSEIMHNRGFTTERTLLVIDHGTGYGIGVRAGKNLFRPAHIFNFLKQKNLDALKRGVQFLIKRQCKNRRWDFKSNSRRKFDLMLDNIVYDYAKFAALLEREYVFAWLDWDGDNCLADAGIIDYGSIRQFGVRHDQYRYDDVERFSTNLNEQKHKAALIIQVFIQLVDFLKTEKYKPLNDFKDHRYMKLFYSTFDYFLLDRYLIQMGLTEQMCTQVLRKHKTSIRKHYELFEKLEKTKTSQPSRPVEDGVNRPAIYNMRKALHELPELISNNFSDEELAKKFHELILVEGAIDEDRELTPYKKNKVLEFLQSYKKMMTVFAKHRDMPVNKFLTWLKPRAQTANPMDRLTGNSLVILVSELVQKKNEGIPNPDIQRIIDHLIFNQSDARNKVSETDNIPFPKANKSKALVRSMLEIVEGYNEDI